MLIILIFSMFAMSDAYVQYIIEGENLEKMLKRELVVRSVIPLKGNGVEVEWMCIKVEWTENDGKGYSIVFKNAYIAKLTYYNKQGDEFILDWLVLDDCKGRDGAIESVPETNPTNEGIEVKYRNVKKLNSVVVSQLYKFDENANKYIRVSNS
ncbi:uncharacterized protein LOC128988681 [Macrosteles quadrilineatus]|uniref:uncharacterized protein LOC128988681 n=1 Tax=Macrosteles quadrilineatus TaxID=74068 RepID=UPI0023E1F6E8|nr:uncharacterized protein LOC128988681 [Macrosteles quadrilineatus]